MHTMTAIGYEFMPSDRHQLSLTSNLGDALMRVAKTLWPHHTAKQAEAAWNIERETAQNVVKGHASAVTVTRAVHAQQARSRDAWALWMALGRELIGEPYEAYEERALTAIIQEAERARANVESLRARRKRLEEVGPFAGLGARVAAGEGRRGRGRRRGSDNGVGGE